MRLQKKNARVKLVIQTKFALNMAKMASLFGMAIQQLTRNQKPGLPVSHLRCWNTGKSPVRLTSTLKLVLVHGENCVMENRRETSL